MKELTIAPRAGKRYLKLLENAIGSSLPDSLNEVILKYAGLTVLEDTYDADEAFVTGTFAGIITVAEIDKRKIKSDEITCKIRELYERKLV